MRIHGPEATEQGGGERDVPPETDRRLTVGAVEHYSCGLAGLLVTAAALVFLYPALVAVTSPLYVLSSVALVFVVITAWVLVWLSLELIWEWRTGRLLPS